MIKSGAAVALIGASSKAFMFYKGGILSLTSGCTATSDFWVALVGYYTSTLNKSYWTIQNSWGVSWGMNGYAQLEMGTNTFSNYGVCGISE